MAHYAQGIPLADLARRLRRSERTVHDWLNGRARVPWWVPELMRLQHQEHHDQLRRMGLRRHTPLRLVSGQLLAFKPKKEPHKAAQVPAGDSEIQGRKTSTL